MDNFSKKLNDNQCFAALYAVFMLLVFVRFVFKIDYPAIILLGLTVLMTFVGTKDQIIAVCMLCIPLTTAFDYSYAVLFAIVIYYIKYQRSIHINISAVIVLFMIIWELMQGITGSFSIKALIVNFLPFILCLLLMSVDAEELDYPYITRAFASSVCIVCVTLVVATLRRAGWSFNNFFFYMSRLGSAMEDDKTTSLVINSNSLGILCSIALAGLFQLIATGNRRSTDVPVMLVLVVCGALTLSRTYIVLLALLVLLIWLAYKESMMKKIKFLLSILSLLLIAFLIFKVLFPESLEFYIGRFKTSDISGGRIDILKEYNNYLSSSLKDFAFGIGLTNYSIRIRQLTGIRYAAHNGFQEAILAWGAIGFIIFLCFLGSMMFCANKSSNKKTLLNFIPLILLLAKIQAGQMLTSGYTMLLFSYCYLSLAQNFEVNNLEPNT